MQISLSESTFERLRRVAKKKKTGVSDLLNLVVENYLAHEPEAELKPDARLIQIEREQHAFETQHVDLLKQYAGQYIAMHEGRVVDHDADRASLGRRVRARYGNETLLITPVLEQVHREIRVRSPHSVKGVEG